jgi:hypothetical protein
MKSTVRASLLVAGIALVAACADTPTASVTPPRFDAVPTNSTPPGEGRGVIGSGTNAGPGNRVPSHPRPPQAELHFIG